MTEQELQNFWNTKHPVNPVVYTGRAIPSICPTCKGHSIKERVNIDVKTMVTVNDCMITDIINRNNLKGNTHDETVLKIQKWIVSNIKYIGDDLSQGTMEYWQFPFETITCGVGDCEDGALLIATLAIAAGVPAFRVRVVAGMVQEAPTAPQGGHGYVCYLRESDNQWVVIDWCYLEDSAKPVSEKPLLKDNSYYKEMWFSFNNEFSWSNKALEFVSF